MTRACIVGWAHSPFGKLENRMSRALVARVSAKRWRMRASRIPRSTASMSAS